VSNWKSSPIKRLQAATISMVGYRLVAALGAAFRAPIRRASSTSKAFSATAATSWLGTAAFSCHRLLPPRGIIVITSENFDSEWIAASSAVRMGRRADRPRGGPKALLRLSRDMAAGKSAAFTLDGPRGPARVAHPGALWLTRPGILCYHFISAPTPGPRTAGIAQIPAVCHRCACGGRASRRPADAGDEALDAARRELESRLHALEARDRLASQR
jgi:hypothetical protein